MTLAQSVIGIDIGKRYLDGHDGATGQTWRMTNTDEAIVPFVATLTTSHLVVFEATGVYDAALRRALAHAGVPHARVNPARARAFAKAAGRLAKTDRIDARMLATLGACLPLRREQAPDAARERLTRLHRRRDALVAMRAAEETRRADALDADICESLEDHIAALNGAVAKIEAAIAQHLADEPHLREAVRLLTSVPGVGPVTAGIIVALLPELGQLSHKRLAALVGLAPFNRDSGQARCPRRIEAGRRRVRQALYMAAVSAARTRFKPFYKRLIAAGKLPKVALIALARKLLTILNAMSKTQSRFQPA